MHVCISLPKGLHAHKDCVDKSSASTATPRENKAQLLHLTPNTSIHQPGCHHYSALSGSCHHEFSKRNGPH